MIMTDRQETIIACTDDLKATLPSSEVRYYGRIDMIYSNSIDKLAENEDLSLTDKIVVAQMLGDDRAVLLLKLQLNPTDEQVEKYKKLRSINAEIDKTLNPDLLDQRYDFLDKRRDIISTDI